jgi:hypothetical protein
MESRYLIITTNVRFIDCVVAFTGIGFVLAQKKCIILPSHV